MTVSIEDRLTAAKLLNDYADAAKTLQAGFAKYDIGCLELVNSYGEVQIQMYRLAKWCELLGIEYIREDWDGNKICNTCRDIIYFHYCGIKFYELVDKEV